MRIDQTLDRHISKILVEENKKERENHVSSGKLSASMLGQPLQWQILKTIGVPPKEVDEYTLRVFKRGKDIEDWLVKLIPGLIDTQVPVEYMSVVGYIDALVDSKNYEFPIGIIPHEIKSVKNSKFKRIVENCAPDRSHCLQASLYGLAKNVPDVVIDYIAADDLRIESFVIKVSDWKNEIEQIISKYNKQLSTKTVPIFVPAESWQGNLEYNNYPEWMDLSEEQIVLKLQREYPQALLKLKNI